MVDFSLTEEQKALQELCRGFAEHYLKPVAADFDRKGAEEPAACFPPDVLKQFASLGLKNLPLPERFGGAEIGVLTHCVLLEELVSAEAGFAATVHQAWKMVGLLNECGSETQHSKYIPMYAGDEACLLGDATIEPGPKPVDILAYICAEGASRLTAARSGAGWVADGTKRFVICGGLARLFFIDALTSDGNGSSSGIVSFILENGALGMRTGKVHDKMGMRLLVDSELILEKCRVPDEDVMFAGEVSGWEARTQYLQKMSPTTGAFGIGIARSALEEAVEHARNRVQGGKPIIEHDIVAVRLAEMAVDVETARALVWRAGWHSDNETNPDPALGLAAALFASEMAPRVCDTAIELFGGYGFMRDYPVQKYWRDALMCYSFDGTSDLARLKMGRLL